jgi:invasion protein IalB
MGRHSSRHLLLWAVAALTLISTGCDSKPPPTAHTTPTVIPPPAGTPPPQAEPLMTVRQFDDWSLACPPPATKIGGCEVSAKVLKADDHTEIARLQITRLNGAETLIVTLPYNTLLEPGMALAFDAAKPQVFPYETCNGVGCVVRIAFDDKFGAEFAAASRSRILFAGLDAKPVGLPYSMRGFADALAAYKREETTRGRK